MPAPSEAHYTRPTPYLAPCIWLEDQAAAAAEHYRSVFPEAEVQRTLAYPTDMDNPSGRPPGSLLLVDLDIWGCPFTLLNGGPAFQPNPTISFFVETDTTEQVDAVATGLGDGGTFLMPLDTYPWSRRYAWVQDRYGVSWQVIHAEGRSGGPRVFPCLMFAGAVHGRAEEALRHYIDAFPASRVAALERYDAGEGPEGTVKHGRALLAGNPLVAMDSHLHHGSSFSEGVSLQVICKDQGEVDHYWARLSEAGEEGPCGWLKDRFGVSWQVVPTELVDLLMTSDEAAYGRVFQRMLEMKRLDIGRLRAAYRDS